MYTKWNNKPIPLGGISPIYGDPNDPTRITGYERGTTTPFATDDAFAVVKRPNWLDKLKDKLGVRKLPPLNWAKPGNIQTWSPRTGFTPGKIIDTKNGPRHIFGSAITQSGADAAGAAFKGTAGISTALSLLDIAGAKDRGEAPGRAWMRNIFSNVGAYAMAIPDAAALVGSGGTAVALTLAANAVVATITDAIGGGVYDFLFGNVWDGKQTEMSKEMGQRRSVGLVGGIGDIFGNIGLPILGAGWNALFGGGKADGGPVDVGRGYDGTLSWLEDYTNPATRFIHQILPKGMSNSNLSGAGGFVDILSSLYKAGLKTVMPGPDLADALARLAGSGKLPGPLEALARNMLGLSQLSNISRPMSLRDTYELDPDLDIVKRGIWGRGSRPLSTGVVRSVVGGLALDYEQLGNLLSGNATDLPGLGGADPITSVVTRAGYKPPHVTTSFNDFLSGDYHFPFFATDPASFPESKRIGLTSALPQSGKGATRLAEFQIPGGIPIDQIETILGLPTLIDDKDGYRPFTDAEAKARAAALAEMGFTDLGNHAVATDVLERQIADWRASSGAMPVDPEQVLEAKEAILRQQETGRILAGRAAQAASLLRAGVFTSIDEAALYATTADEHFKGVRARRIDIEAERTRVARTIPRGGSFEDKVAAIRERLLFTQPELFDLGPAEASPLRLVLDDAPEIKRTAGSQLELFSRMVEPFGIEGATKYAMPEPFEIQGSTLGLPEGMLPYWTEPGVTTQVYPVSGYKPGAMTASALDLPPDLTAKNLVGTVSDGGVRFGTTSLMDRIRGYLFNRGIPEIRIGDVSDGTFPPLIPESGLPTLKYAMDWGDLIIPSGKTDFSYTQLHDINRSVRLALAMAPEGMFDPNDPKKRLSLNLFDHMGGTGTEDGVLGFVGQLRKNEINVQTGQTTSGSGLNSLQSTITHEIGHLIQDRLVQARAKSKPLTFIKNLLQTPLRGFNSIGERLNNVMHGMNLDNSQRLFTESLRSVGLNSSEADYMDFEVTDPSDPKKFDAYPGNYPSVSKYGRKSAFENFATIFQQHVLSTLYPDQHNLFGADDTSTIAKLATTDPVLAEAHKQYVRKSIRDANLRTIDLADTTAIARGLRPEMYTPANKPRSDMYSRLATSISNSRFATRVANSSVGQTYGRASDAIKNSMVGKADTKLGKFGSTGKGNFITGFLADIAMMVASGNWDFGALISSAGFNLISALPKLGGPAAMAAGLLTTAATGGDMGRAIAGTVGSLIGGVLGNLIPIPFVGGMVGSILGGMLGDWVYTTFLNPESANQGNATIQAAGKAVYNVGPNSPFTTQNPKPYNPGARAFGGSVKPNLGYMVGERGPELLVPGGLGGSIIPNHKLRGPQGVSAVAGGQTVNASVVINNPSVSNSGDIDKLAKKVAEAQTRALRSAGYARPR
jgi:hypothetical protein